MAAPIVAFLPLISFGVGVLVGMFARLAEFPAEETTSEPEIKHNKEYRELPKWTKEKPDGN